MRLVVGLGNPGKKYEKTRHNVGFLVIDELAKDKPKDFVLAKPKTFMNQSGKAVKQLISNLKSQISNLVIVHDDIDLPFGEFKIQKNRGAAGHKGVQSIIDELATKNFWRVRVGICPKEGKPKNVEKFVLQNFTDKEEKIVKATIKKTMQEIVGK